MDFLPLNVSCDNCSTTIACRDSHAFQIQTTWMVGDIVMDTDTYDHDFICDTCLPVVTHGCVKVSEDLYTHTVHAG